MTGVSVQVTALTPYLGQVSQVNSPLDSLEMDFFERGSSYMQSWNMKVQYIYIHHYAYIYIYIICLNVSHLSCTQRPLVGRIHHRTGIRALLESTLRSARKSHVIFRVSYGGSERPGSNISNLVVYGFKIHSAKPTWITVKYRRPLGFLQLWQVAFTGNAHGLLVVGESQRTGIYGWRWTLGLGGPAASNQLERSYINISACLTDSLIVEYIFS